MSKGAARCPGPGWDELMAADTVAPPAFLKADAYEYMGSAPLAAARYVDAGFFRRELEAMWPNVWQFAAREEDLPEPGDVVVYENAGRSYLLARQPDGEVRAFHNVCLHRGRKLRTESGRASEFRCPFHGFTWRNDGSLKEIPCRWDFPHLTDEAMRLPQADVGRWGGYVFVKENPGGPSLEDYLAPLPEHFQRWRHEDCVTAVWVGKVIHANWKATAEAFMEAWHSLVTHPQILGFTGDANSRYNVYGDHVNVALTPFGVLSPHLDPSTHSEQWVADEVARFSGRGGGSEGVKLGEGQRARPVLAAANRQRFAAMSGRDLSHASDAEILDAFTYNVFPNFAPWGGFAPNIVYRWRPWPDQDRSLMEVRLLVRTPPGAPRRRGPPMRLLADDEPWTAAEGLPPALAGVFEQDMGNLALVQEGLKASKTGEVNLGDYQEVRIRHFHRTLDQYLERFDGAR